MRPLLAEILSMMEAGATGDRGQFPAAPSHRLPRLPGRGVSGVAEPAGPDAHGTYEAGAPTGREALPPDQEGWGSRGAAPGQAGAGEGQRQGDGAGQALGQQP